MRMIWGNCNEASDSFDKRESVKIEEPNENAAEGLDCLRQSKTWC